MTWMRPKPRRWIKITAAVLAGLALAGAALYDHAGPGIRLMMRLNEPAPGEAVVAVEELGIPADEARGSLPLLVYRPREIRHRPVLVVHGVHADGYREERLVGFSRRVAGLGAAVVTPDLRGLRSFELTPEIADEVERAALWLAGRTDLAPPGGDGRIDLLGISFGGGMALGVAARPTVRDRIAAVLSFGGFGDLDRTARYLVTGELEGGGELEPHVYGVAFALRHVAPSCVAEEDVPRLRAALSEYLAGDEDAAARRLDTLGEPARELLRLCLDRDTKELGRRLLPHIRSAPFAPELSPERGRPPACPVFVLHGSVDNVIPPSESRGIARWARAHTPTELLISDQVVHVDLEDGPERSLRDTWDLAVFLTKFLDA